MPAPTAAPLGMPQGTAMWATRLDALLTRERLRVYPVILLALWIVSYVVVRVQDPTQPPLPDFAARWSAGRMLLDGHADHLYDPEAQSRIQAAQLGSTALSWFVSPPFVAAAVSPLSALPYGLACVVWTIVSIACLGAAAWLLKPLAPPVLRGPNVLLILVAAAPTLELLGSGQDTSLCLLAVALGIRLLAEGWQVAAGLILSAGLIKPHLMLLVPLVLLAQHAIRALLAFCAGAALLLVASWALVGWSGVLTWLHTPSTPLYSSEVIHGQAWKSPTLSGFLIGLPPSAPQWWLTAATVVALATTILAVRAWRAQRHTATPIAVWGLALLTTAVAAPHVMLYDLVFVMPALIALSTVAWDARTRALLAVTFVLLWLMPFLHSLASQGSWPFSLIGLPWAGLGVLALWIRLVRLGASRAPMIRTT